MKTIVSNSGSGRSEQLNELKIILQGQPTHWIDLSETKNLCHSIQRMVDNGSDTIIAAGGDGTVNATVNALMSIEAQLRPSLGIIPLGTANDFAGTLNIPDDLDSAAAKLWEPPIPVDVVRVEGKHLHRYFANMAAGGNCVRVSEALTDELKARWGAFSYMRGAVEVLPDMTSYHVDVICDDEHLHQLPLWAVLVANGKTNAGKIEVAPRASVYDGLMDVILIRDGSIGDMVEIIANNLMGSFLESEQVIFRQVRSLDIHSVPPMRFTIDGEVVDQKPIRFQVIPQAIRMHSGDIF